MKKLFFALALLIAGYNYAQSPVDFTVNDCNGNSHTLFNELNAGKVVLIVWVMPCQTCTAGMTYAANIANSYTLSNPGKVLLYIADDYANSNCTGLTNWINGYGVTTNRSIFSNTVINMTDYGTAGMPKVVVLGGINTHSVYYNENGAANNQTNMQNAVTLALNDVTGLSEKVEANLKTSVSPNPASSEINITYQSGSSLNSLEIFNALGQKVKSIKTNDNKTNDNSGQIKANVSDLESGAYFLKMQNQSNSSITKFIIVK